MLPAVQTAAMNAAQEGERRRVRRMLVKLQRSDRYLRAVAEEGATRFNANGEPAGFVSEDQRRWALKVLQEKAESEARYHASVTTGDKSQIST
jgi:sRNA-binding protein